MRYILVIGLLVVVCTVPAAYGGKKHVANKETTVLASEVASKIVHRTGTTVTVTAPDICLLHIDFESLNASFDLPLQDATAVENDAEDTIMVQNKHMTRKIKDRAAEPFERLTLRFSRPNLKSVMKSFTDAISVCNLNKSAVVAAN